MPPAEYARSGFHSGQTASGYFDESFGIFIAGTDRTKKCHFDSLDISERTGDAPNECRLDVRGFTPTKLQELKIFNGGVDVGVPVFCGHLINLDQDGRNAAQRPTFHLIATDYVWLLDRYALITKTYRNVGINTMVGDILATYTDGGFVPGYLPQSLGDIAEMSFTQTPVSEALRRIAATVSGAQLRIDYQKRVSIFTTAVDAANSIDLSASGTDFWDMRYVVDPSQWRTRVVWEGGGGATTALVSVGATTVAVDECGWYSSSGGTARAGTVVFTYTGVSAASGPGTLTGCSGIADDISQGEAVYLLVQLDNATAQTTLAGILGGGYSGVAVHYQADNRLALVELTARAQTDLDFYSAALERFTYTTTNPYVRVGRSVAVALTQPTTINTTLVVQEQHLRGRHKDANATTLALDRHISLAPVERQITDALIDAGVH